MGYNGSNRRGVRSSMFSKRNSKSGNNLISGLLGGLLGAPFALLSMQVDTSTVENTDMSKGCFMTSLIIMGIFCLCIEFWILNIFGVILISVAICMFAIDKRKKKSLITSKNELGAKKIHKICTPIINIDNKVRHKLISDYSFEVLFHFTQPLIDLTTFSNNKTFSYRFRQKFREYRYYKDQWNYSYWHYSIHMKVHTILKSEAEIKSTLNINNESLFYDSFKRKLFETINRDERKFFNRVTTNNEYKISSFLSYYDYNQIVIHSKKPTIDLLLKEDFNNRLKDISSCLYLKYGGNWNPEYINWFENLNDKRLHYQFTN